MREAGKLASSILTKIKKSSVPGTSTLELNKIAEEEIDKAKMKPGFKTVADYQFAICTTPNHEVVHGLPSDYLLKRGDILGIDLGVMNDGLHTDTAVTFEIKEKGEKGPINPKTDHFLKTGEETLKKAISIVKGGVKVGNVSSLIQKNVEGAGYHVVRELVGHGIGYQLHEDPLIPGIGRKGTGVTLAEGMTIAVEIIYTMGKAQVVMLPDGWTIITKDRQMAAVFEHTVLVTKSGPVVLTQE